MRQMHDKGTSSAFNITKTILTEYDFNSNQSKKEYPVLNIPLSTNGQYLSFLI